MLNICQLVTSASMLLTYELQSQSRYVSFNANIHTTSEDMPQPGVDAVELDFFNPSGLPIVKLKLYPSNAVAFLGEENMTRVERRFLPYPDDFVIFNDDSPDDLSAALAVILHDDELLVTIDGSTIVRIQHLLLHTIQKMNIIFDGEKYCVTDIEMSIKLLPDHVNVNK